MTKRPLGPIASDFGEVLKFLKGRNFIPDEPTKEMLAHAKLIHTCTYSLMLWRHRLPKLEKHGKVFLDEVASDALQILPQVMLGYGKTAILLCRGILENTLRHIYFSDHPIEFQRMNREKWFLGMEQLIEYAKNHPEFLKTEKQFNALGQLSGLYSELSATVHGSSVKHLEMRIALKKIIYTETSAKTQCELIEKCSQVTNFLLAIFHQDRMLKFDRADKQIILRAMPAPARQIWTLHERTEYQ